MSDVPQGHDDELPPGDADAALAGEYALGLLPPEEARAFEERLAVEPGLRALYAGWAESFAALADDTPLAEPPAALRAEVESRLFAPAASPDRGRRGFLWFGLAGLAAAAVATVVAVDLGRGPDAPALRATIAAEDGSLVVLADLRPAIGEIAVQRRAGQAAPGRALELWLIAGQDAPVSLGLLPEDGDGSLAFDPALADRLDGAILAISDEPPGGSPTGQPTGPVLATGAIAAP